MITEAARRSSSNFTGTDGSRRWTVSTVDGSLAAHTEHTIVVRAGARMILTA